MDFTFLTDWASSFIVEDTNYLTLIIKKIIQKYKNICTKVHFYKKKNPKRTILCKNPKTCNFVQHKTFFKLSTSPDLDL
jgi:hypothetical protein